MVSSARNAPSAIVVIFGSAITVDASTSRPTSRAEQPQPRGRELARVQREQAGAGHAHQPLGGPDLPARAAVHRVEALGHADAEQAHPDQYERRVRRQVRHRRGRDHEQRPDRSLPPGTPCPRPPPRRSRARAAPRSRAAVRAASTRGRRRRPTGASARAGSTATARRSCRSAARARPPSADRRGWRRGPSTPRRSRSPCRSGRPAAACCARRWWPRRRSGSCRGARCRRRPSSRRGPPPVPRPRPARSSACP